MHFQNAPDNLLFSLVLHDGTIHASFSKRKSVHPIYRATLIFERDSKANQGLPDSRFGGRELAGNLP
jgi:hypothetical protein